MFYTLTVIAIGGQIALRDFIGDFGCKIYALSFLAIAGWFIYGGLGLAIFRMLCLRDKTMTNCLGTIRGVHTVKYKAQLFIN